MSAAMSPTVAAAASGLALAAEAAALGLPVHELVRRRAHERIRANVAARAKGGAESLPGRTWRGIAIEARKLLVLLAADEQGDADRLARKPWESFSEADRLSMAALARMLSRELAGARCLW